MLDIASLLGMRVTARHKELAGMILNEKIVDIRELETRTDCPSGLIGAILEDFEASGYIRVVRVLGGPGAVHSPSAGFKRWLRDA